MDSLVNGRTQAGSRDASQSPDVSSLKAAAASPAAAAPSGSPRGLKDQKTMREALDYVMDIIYAEQLDTAKQEVVMKETVANWAEHVNPGFLQYRKSVAEDFAAIEWRDGRPGGATVLDASGKEYIDLLGGFGIYNVGHSHPYVVNAVKRQMDKQSLHSQELLDPLRAYCATLLAKTLPGDLQYAFFTNSGTESVEACLKMAMLATGRRHFVGVVGAFHGKTLGSLSGTSKSVFRKPFSGGLLSFSHIPVNDCEALKRAFESAAFTGTEIAGFLVEPVLGEGGIHVCSREFLQLARKLCDEHGACLIFDEVQSGMGRTGKYWACEWSDVAPDLMAIGKAFGGGVSAAGAAVGNYKAWHKYFENPFLHTTTFGGNPCAMAAAIACMHVIESEGLVEQAREKGEWMAARLQALQAKHSNIMSGVRGRGLMLGMVFPSDDIGYAFSKGVFSRGIVLSGTLINSKVLRVEPPITITYQEMETVLQRFEDTLEELQRTLAGKVPPRPAVLPSAEGSAGAATTAGAGLMLCPADQLLPTISEEEEGQGPAALKAAASVEEGLAAAAAAAGATLPSPDEADSDVSQGSGDEEEESDAGSVSTAASSVNPRQRMASEHSSLPLRRLARPSRTAAAAIASGQRKAQAGPRFATTAAAMALSASAGSSGSSSASDAGAGSGGTAASAARARGLSLDSRVTDMVDGESEEEGAEHEHDEGSASEEEHELQDPRNKKATSSAQK